MQIIPRALTSAASIAVVCGTLTATLWLAPVAPAAADEASIAEGKKLAFDRKKGNCLACHMMDDGNLPGNIGPPLIAMKQRFPSKADLRQQISDARLRNPSTIMPPFGAHGILSGDEIDKITDYVHSL